MPRTLFNIRPRQTGIGLVEILVALAIGLITAAIVLQVMTSYERQKLTAGSAADTQTSGAVALYMLQRHAQFAGYGLPIANGSASASKCTEVMDYTVVPAQEVNISPVTIRDGGNGPDGMPGASDIITIRTGNSRFGGMSTKISSVAANPRIQLTNNMGCEASDYAILFNEDTNKCSFDRVLDVPARHADGTVNTTDIVLRWGSTANDRSQITCLGSWSEIDYSVNNRELWSDNTPIAANIVNIQAQYGIASNVNAPEVLTWVEPNAPGLDRNLIRAIRIAVVAASTHMEDNVVSNPCSSLVGPAVGVCAWEGTNGSPAPAINLSSIPNWQRYRYRVFSTIVPVRNMIWNVKAFTNVGIAP